MMSFWERGKPPELGWRFGFSFLDLGSIVSDFGFRISDLETAMSNSNVSITSPAGLVSILIPCTGMLEYTRLCIPSVLRCSRDPFELIFLDVGSLDGTAEYLAGLR